MPLIPLTVYRQESIYLTPPVVRYVNTEHIIHIWDNQWYKTQADEDTQTNRDGTQINIGVDGIVYSTWIVGESAADIAAASGSGGGGTPTNPLKNVAFPYIQISNYQVGTITQSGLSTEDFTAFTIYNENESGLGDLPMTDRAAFYQLLKSAISVIMTYPDQAAGVPEAGTTTYYIGYSSEVFQQHKPNKALDQWIIKRIIERESGETEISYAEGNSFNFNLIFDSGTQEFLNYTY